MKRILLTFLFIITVSATTVEAKNLNAIALEDFSTEHPNKTFKIQTIELTDLQNGTLIQEGTIIEGTVTKVQNPKRGKQNGYFELKPTLFTYNGETKTIGDLALTAQVIDFAPIDPKKMTVSVAKKAAGFAFKGATQGISFAEGFIKAKNGQRITSGLKKVYKDSPLSFVEYGKELNIQTGDLVTLKFKQNKKANAI